MKNMNATSDAVIYATAARANKDAHSSVDEQLEHCRHYAMLNGYQIQREFSAVGMNEDETLAEILRFLEDHPDYHLIAERVDRLTLSDFYSFEQLGIMVHFAEEDQAKT